MTLPSPWDRPATRSATPSLGRRARAHTRAEQETRRLLELHQLILHESPELAHGKSPTEGQVAIDRIVRSIREESASPADLRTKLNYFSVGIDRGNRKGLWELRAPPVFVNQNRFKLLRDEAYFRRGTEFVELRKRFIRALESFQHTDPQWAHSGPDAQRRLRGAVILACASLVGGLCHAKLLARMPEALATQGLQRYGNQLWLDLRIPDSEADHLNLPGEDEGLYRWCPDDLTAGLIAHFHRHHDPQDFPRSSKDDAASRYTHVLRSIRELFSALLIPFPAGISLDEWSLGAWAALERLPEGQIPAYLAEHALGRTVSCSLPTDRWVAILNQRVAPTPLGDVPDEAPLNAPSLPRPPILAGNPDPDTRPISRELLKACRDQYPKRLTKSACIKALEDLLAGSALGQHVTAQLLAHWAIVLLKHGSSWRQQPLAPSTVYGKYLAPLTRPLLALLQSPDDHDIREFDSDDFELLYEDVLQRVRWDDKDVPAHALQEFHHYLVTQHDCAPLDSPLATTKQGTPRVRALIVTEAEYRVTRSHVQKIRASNWTHAELLEMALFLGFRAGMRPAEVLKLRLREIYVGDTDTTITIRTNRYARNKNRPSLRRVNLRALCPESEYQWFAQRISQLQARTESNRQALVISEAAERNCRVTPDFLRAHLQPLLRRATHNPHILFYSLRHSALTHLHLRIEVPEHLHEILHPDDPTPNPESVVPSLTGGNARSMKRLNAISAIAGHASPHTTLTTYLHGLELILHRKIQDTLPRLEADTYAYLLGRNYESVRRYLKDHQASSPAPANALKPWIVKSLDAQAHPEPKGQMPTALEPSPPRAIPVTVIETQRILKDYDHGYSLTQIAHRSGCDQAGCENTIRAARQVASIRSCKGHPRFITQSRLLAEPDREAPLAPSLPASAEDQVLATAMINNLRPVLKDPESRAQVAPLIEYFLGHVEAHNSGVRFYDLEMARRFVDLLDTITGARGQILGKHTPSAGSSFNDAQQRQHWATVLKIAVRAGPQSKPLTRNGGTLGKLVVSFTLVTTGNRLVSARAYKYVLHLAAIALLARGYIQLP